MRFLVDECSGPAVANWLRAQGHDVVSVYHEHRGISDDQVMALAQVHNRILITNDKLFADRIYRDRLPHVGVILLRLVNERSANKISVLARLLKTYSDKIAGRFVVVTESRVRFAHAWDLDWQALVDFCDGLGLKRVPLVDGNFLLDRDVAGLLALADAPSLLNPAMKREGIVIRPLTEQHDTIDGQMSRLSFKAISNAYLLARDE